MTCDDPELPGESNLALLAAEALCRYTGERRGAHIHVSKNIPVAAGLGGGSADAAAALRALNRLWETCLTDIQLQVIAAGIGSDVPFLVNGGTALVAGQGRGCKAAAKRKPRLAAVGVTGKPDRGQNGNDVLPHWTRLCTRAACCPTNLPVESSAAVTYRRSFSSTYSGPLCAMCSRAGRSLTTGSCRLAQGRYSSAAPDPPCSLCRRAERSAWHGSCYSNNGGSGLSSPGHGGRTQPLHRDPVPELITLAAGAITGAIIGLVFITHAALLLVWDPPPRLAQRASTTGAAGLLMMASFAAFVVWQFIGVAAAVFFEFTYDQYPTRFRPFRALCTFLLSCFSLRCWPCRQSFSCGAEPGTSPLSTFYLSACSAF